MKYVIIFCLLITMQVTAYGQSRQWMFAPDQKMASITGAILTPFPSGSDITTCVAFPNNREGVYTNISGTASYVGFNRCGFYNVAGAKTYGWGSDNFIGVPGQCNKYFSLRWETPGIHINIDQLVLRGYEYDATAGTFIEISKDILVDNGA